LCITLLLRALQEVKREEKNKEKKDSKKGNLFFIEEK
jgi:hypothetical protein